MYTYSYYHIDIVTKSMSSFPSKYQIILPRLVFFFFFLVDKTYLIATLGNTLKYIIY